MRRSCLLTATVTLLALAGCGHRTTDDERAAIYEAVFRHQFAHNASALQQAASVYCLHVGQGDPSAELLRRFEGHVPPVKAASACSAGPGGVRDSPAGAPGLVFRVDTLRRKGANRAEVDGGYYEAGLSSSGNTYFLERRDGVWVVVRNEMRWISERSHPSDGPLHQPASLRLTAAAVDARNSTGARSRETRVEDMDVDRFWAIVGESRAGFDPRLRDGNMDRQVQRLRQLLGDSSPAEIAQFQRQFDERMGESYRWDLWGAAYVIEGGCSDDGFTDFRSWLIAMGRDVFEAALRDPETLVDVADAEGVEVTSFEEFAYVPRQVYEEKTGDEMPDTDVEHPREPAGDKWSEEGDNLARRLPKLWAKYGDA